MDKVQKTRGSRRKSDLYGVGVTYLKINCGPGRIGPDGSRAGPLGIPEFLSVQTCAQGMYFRRTGREGGVVA